MLTISNYIFTIIFVGEMTLKVRHSFSLSCWPWVSTVPSFAVMNGLNTSTIIEVFILKAGHHILLMKLKVTPDWPACALREQRPCMHGPVSQHGCALPDTYFLSWPLLYPKNVWLLVTGAKWIETLSHPLLALRERLSNYLN